MARREVLPHEILFGFLLLGLTCRLTVSLGVLNPTTLSFGIPLVGLGAIAVFAELNGSENWNRARHACYLVLIPFLYVQLGRYVSAANAYFWDDRLNSID